MRPARAALLALALVSLSACASGPKQFGGALLGGAAGGLAGAQVGDGRGQLAATAAGALLGGFLGSEAGLSLDRADAVHAAGRPRSEEFAPVPAPQVHPHAMPQRVPQDSHRYYGPVPRAQCCSFGPGPVASPAWTYEYYGTVQGAVPAPRSTVRNEYAYGW